MTTDSMRSPTDQHATSASDANDNNPGRLRSHPTYFWNFIRFKVEDCAIQLPKARFISDSDVFAKEYGILPDVEGEVGIGGTHELDVSLSDFDAFLKAFLPGCPSHRHSPVDLSLKEWLSVLDLSSRWRFIDLRNEAISKLDRLLTNSTQRVLLARRYTVPSWLGKGYLEILDAMTYTQDNPTFITQDVAQEIGFPIALELSNIMLKQYYARWKLGKADILDIHTSYLLDTELGEMERAARQYRMGSDWEQDDSADGGAHELKRSREEMREEGIPPLDTRGTYCLPSDLTGDAISDLSCQHTEATEIIESPLERSQMPSAPDPSSADQTGTINPNTRLLQGGFSPHNGPPWEWKGVPRLDERAGDQSVDEAEVARRTVQHQERDVLESQKHQGLILEQGLDGRFDSATHLDANSPEGSRSASVQMDLPTQEDPPKLSKKQRKAMMDLRKRQVYGVAVSLWQG